MRQIMSFTEAQRMLREIWFLYKQYAVHRLDEGELENFQESANLIYQKYKTPFTKAIVLAVIEEIERSVKHFEEKQT